MRGIGGTLFRLDYMLGTAIVACQLLNLQGLTSAFFYATFVVSFLLWICTVAHGFDWVNGLALVTVLLALLHVALNALLADADFTWNYMKKYAMFGSTVIFLDAVRKYRMGRADFRRLKFLYLSVGFLMLALYRFRSGAMHLLHGQSTRYLTLGFTNPNLTALFLACMILFLTVAWLRERRATVRLLLFPVAVAEIVLLRQTESRNALLAVAIFAVLIRPLFRRGRRGRKAGYSKGFLGLVSVSPLLFALLYMRISRTSAFAEFFSFAAGEGKELDSRAEIWGAAFRHFLSSPVLGAYCQISNGTGVSQLHNTHVDILASYGISVLVLTCVFLYVLMRQLRDEASNNALTGFICVLFLGIGEAALFSGGLGIYLFFGVFLGVREQAEARRRRWVLLWSR